MTERTRTRALLYVSALAAVGVAAYALSVRAPSVGAGWLVAALVCVGWAREPMLRD